MKKQQPKYALHKATGQARVRINGKSIYLGPYGSEESRRRYDEIVADYMKGTLTQGQRTLNSFDTKDLHQEVIIPATDSAFHSEAVLAGMLFQQGQSEASEPCKILSNRALASSQSVFSIRDIQTPVASGFDSPVLANSLGKLLNAKWQTADEIANVELLFALHDAVIDNHANRLQTLPSRRRSEGIWNFKLQISA